MDALGQGDSERQLIRRISTHAGVPAVVRRMAARIEASPLAYRLAHGVFWSLAGTALARVLALAASVITARILGKQGYGELGVVNSTLLTLQGFASLGLGATATKYVAELRGKDSERAGRILALSATISGASGLLGMAVLWAFADWIAVHMINAPQLAGLLRRIDHVDGDPVGDGPQDSHSQEARCGAAGPRESAEASVRHRTRAAQPR